MKMAVATHSQNGLALGRHQSVRALSPDRQAAHRIRSWQRPAVFVATALYQRLCKSRLRPAHLTPVASPRFVRRTIRVNFSCDGKPCQAKILHCTNLISGNCRLITRWPARNFSLLLDWQQYRRLTVTSAESSAGKMAIMPVQWIRFRK